jgi:hypothetical protein
MMPEENPWHGCEKVDRLSAAITLAAVLTIGALIQEGGTALGELSAKYIPSIHKSRKTIEQVVTTNYLGIQKWTDNGRSFKYSCGRSYLTK